MDKDDLLAIALGLLRTLGSTQSIEKEEMTTDKEIEKELLEAYYNNYKEFHLEYQPQLDLKTNRIMGVEALARWNSSKLGLIPPNKFITIAEKSDTINHLGFWVMETAFKFSKELEECNIKDVKVAINISVIQLLQEDFIERTLSILKTMDVNPRNLKIEITESALIENYEFVNDKLELLKKHGIAISLDDFGTGQSSLYRVKALNIDYLKIDKSFIDHIVNKEEDILINSILSMSKELDLVVIAEGVETQIQKEYLETKGCDAIQGYLLSKPLKQEKVIKLINDTNQRR